MDGFSALYDYQDYEDKCIEWQLEDLQENDEQRTDDNE